MAHAPFLVNFCIWSKHGLKFSLGGTNIHYPEQCFKDYAFPLNCFYTFFGVAGDHLSVVSICGSISELSIFFH